MAISKPILQQRLPFVDSAGRLSNEGLRALNDALGSLFEQINQIAELYNLTSDLNSGLSELGAASVLLRVPSTGFANGRVLSAGNAIGLTPSPGILTVSFAGTSDNVPEGSTNLYFTAARGRSFLSAATPVLYDSGTGIISLGTVPETKGGTGFTSYLAGDMIYAANGTTLARLGIGVNGAVLTSNGSLPSWTASTGTGSIARAAKPQFANTIGVGTAAAATGNGVTFPSSPSGSTDPNTLDDYAEGTWTPTVVSASGSLTSVSASGAYTKIGRLVTVTVEILITTNGTGAVGINFTLPFANNGAMRYFGVGRERGPTGGILQVSVDPGSSFAAIQTYNNGYPGGDGFRPSVTLTYAV